MSKIPMAEKAVERMFNETGHGQVPVNPLSAVVCNRLKANFPLLNTRGFTEDDFFTFCDREGIKVFFHPGLPFENGIYLHDPVMDTHRITLDPELDKTLLRRSMFYQAAFYILHGIRCASECLPRFPALKERQENRSRIASHCGATVLQFPKLKPVGD